MEDKGGITKDKFFETDHLTGNLKSHAVRGGMITVLAQVLKVLFRLGSMVALARLLTPNDFGLIAMVTAILAFADLFKDFGLSMATVQRQEINHQQVTNLFWINAAIGLIVTIIIAACSPAIAWFYSEPLLQPIAMVLSVTILFGALGVQHQAILRRQMRFKVIAAAEIVSMMAGIVTGITMALYDMGYWALIGMAITTAIVFLAVVWFKCGWLPGLPFPDISVRAHLSFGTHIGLSSVMAFLSRNADNILIGWRWGSEQLGFYNRAYQLFMLPTNQINVPLSKIAIPTLSRLQSDEARYRKYFKKALFLVNAIGIPLTVILAVLADELTPMLFGKQWGPVGAIFMVLAIGGIFQSLTTAIGWLYTTLGRTVIMLRMSVIGGVVVLLSFVIGLPYGALGVAVSYVAARYLLLIPILFVATRCTPITIMDIGSVLTIPIMSGVVAGLTSYGAMQILQTYLGNSLAVIFSSITAFTLAIGWQVLVERGGTLKEVISEVSVSKL